MTTKYLTLEEYETIAKKILNASFPKVSNWVTKDPDRFGQIVTALISADWQWDGRGTLVGYRKQRVSWCLKTLLSKEKKKMMSIHHCFNDSVELLDTIPDEIGPDLVEYADKIDVLLKKVKKSSVLTKREKSFIERYFTNISLDHICEDFGISKECVKSTIKRGLDKMGKIE